MAMPRVLKRMAAVAASTERENDPATASRNRSQGAPVFSNCDDPPKATSAVVESTSARQARLRASGYMSRPVLCIRTRLGERRSANRLRTSPSIRAGGLKTVFSQSAYRSASAALHFRINTSVSAADQQMARTRQGRTIAASVNALPWSSVCSRDMSVEQELPQSRHAGEPDLRSHVGLEHGHQPRAPERVEEVGHLLPVAGPMVVGLRCAERVQAAAQRLQRTRKAGNPRRVGVLGAEVD